MGQEIQCFLLEPADVAEVSLRRFTYTSEGCAHSWGHDAKAVIGQVPFPHANNLEGEVEGGMLDHADPRWPKKCEACGYVFREADEWQVSRHRMYQHPEVGLVVLGRAPPGSMWYASWLRELDGFERSPDGNVLVVRTPGGDWVVDGPSNNGNGWTRSGKPPHVTANPSIVAGSYHGFLRDGKLIEV